MTIPPLAFKIAVALLQDKLAPQASEPADTSTPQTGQSVLSLLGKQTATATEPAPKVVTDSGKQS